MKRKILIEKKEKKVWTFLLENDSITEIHCTPENDEKARYQIGDIYIGKVQNIVANIGAAFIEIAPGVNCYFDLHSTLTEAIDLIRRTKDNELIFTIVPFADARRFNAEGTFARALSKTWEGQTYTLTPASHLWIMPFPAGAVQNPGNGTITQNVSK